MSDSSANVEWRALQLAKRLRHAHVLPILGIWLLYSDGETSPADVESPQPRNGNRVSKRPAWLVVVMPLVDATLADRQAEKHDGKVPAEQLLSYFSDIAKAIDYLCAVNTDRSSLQHCDIKPANIGLLGSSAVLIDFGLLQNVKSDAEATPGGSPAYMAPERIRGEPPTATSDQYSLAISYYESRTGRLPFHNCSHAAIQRAHLRGNLDLQRLPAAEQRVIRKATSLDPAERFSSTVEFVQALSAGYRKAAAAERATSEAPATTAAESERETCRFAEAKRETNRPGPGVSDSSGELAQANALGMKYYRAGDHAVAFTFFSQAAIADDPAAQNNLGVCYLLGRGVEQRKDLASLWFQRAAVNGNKAALNNLARCHALPR
jgi:serine/threonine protein kinase